MKRFSSFLRALAAYLLLIAILTLISGDTHGRYFFKNLLSASIEIIRVAGFLLPAPVAVYFVSIIQGVAEDFDTRKRHIMVNICTLIAMCMLEAALVVKSSHLVTYLVCWGIVLALILLCFFLGYIEFCHRDESAEDYDE